MTAGKTQPITEPGAQPLAALPVLTPPGLERTPLSNLLWYSGRKRLPAVDEGDVGVFAGELVQHHRVQDYILHPGPEAIEVARFLEVQVVQVD